jgi:hypothetical protein
MKCRQHECRAYVENIFANKNIQISDSELSFIGLIKSNKLIPRNIQIAKFLFE